MSSTDFRYIIPFIVQFGLYLSPVGFTSGMVREKFGDTVFYFYSLNPMVGVIDGFRWALLGGQADLWWPGVLVAAVITFILCASGIWYFRKMEKTFADVI